VGAIDPESINAILFVDEKAVIRRTPNSGGLAAPSLSPSVDACFSIRLQATEQSGINRYHA
jgi:hypothetical protein